jgi:hypothetical protein
MEGGMNARRVGLLAGLVTMAAAGWYFAVYLGRWEWNRAVVAGVIFLAAEVGLLGVVLLDRLSQLHRRLDARDLAERDSGRDIGPRADVDPGLLDRLHENPPPPRKPFTWLDDSAQRMSVFVPVLLGAGVLLSGAAWVVERIGRLTAGPSIERRLARRLDSLALPPGGLLGDTPPDPFWPSESG